MCKVNHKPRKMYFSANLESNVTLYVSKPRTETSSILMLQRGVGPRAGALGGPQPRPFPWQIKLELKYEHFEPAI